MATHERQLREEKEAKQVGTVSPPPGLRDGHLPKLITRPGNNPALGDSPDSKPAYRYARICPNLFVKPNMAHGTHDRQRMGETVEKENSDTNQRVCDAADEWDTGGEFGPGATTFMAQANRPRSKEAAQQAVSAWGSLIRAAGSSGQAVTQLQTINCDSRAPEIKDASDGVAAYPWITEEIQEVIDYGAKLVYYGPHPTYPEMFGYPLGRSESWEMVENMRILTMDGKMFVVQSDRFAVQTVSVQPLLGFPLNETPTDPLAPMAV